MRTASPLEKAVGRRVEADLEGSAFSSARARISSAAPSIVSRRSNGAICSSKSPASSFDWSSMSDSSRSSTWAEDCTSVDHVALVGAERGARQHAGDADHAVQRRADLVAHVGDEHALGGVGALGDVAGGLQLELQRLARGDVDGGADRPPGPAVRRARDQPGARQHPFVAAVLAAHPQFGAGVRGLAAEVGGEVLLERRHVVGMDEAASVRRRSISSGS